MKLNFKGIKFDKEFNPNAVFIDKYKKEFFFNLILTQ